MRCAGTLVAERSKGQGVKKIDAGQSQQDGKSFAIADAEIEPLEDRLAAYCKQLSKLHADVTEASDECSARGAPVGFGSR